MAHYRKVIKITALDSPNVRLALAQIAAGQEPTDEIIVPGVLSWQEYQTRLALWDKIRQTVSLWAEFWHGPEVWLFPLEWRNRARDLAAKEGWRHVHPRWMGIDSAQGGDKTAWAVVNRGGLIHLESARTSDTSVINKTTKALAQRFGVPWGHVLFDSGGGGYQHFCNLRDEGFECRTVGFGETIQLSPKRGIQFFDAKVEVREEKYVYCNRRAQMYGDASELADFAVPLEEGPSADLHEQMSKIPKEYDAEGRLKIRSKGRKPGERESGLKTLIELLGRSPDELDAFVLAIHGMTNPLPRGRAGAA